MDQTESVIGMIRVASESVRQIDEDAARVIDVRREKRHDRPPKYEISTDRSR